MDVLKTIITVSLILFPVIIKSEQNIQEYSNNINQRKNEINKKQQRARKLLDEFLREIDVSCQEIICNFDVSMCGFVQGTNDKFDWTRHQGRTPSNGTGPSFDHTSGNLTGYYMYIEASSPRQPGDNAKLYSPLMKFFGNMCLQFYYHMSGATNESLKVNVSGNLVLSARGDKGGMYMWRKASVNVSAIEGLHRVTFEGVVGSSDIGDIAIDDFSLTAGSCPYGCSGYYFEKYQDLPTRGAHAVEHFTIHGNLFLAFANYHSDTSEKHNTDSFIYKFNDSTGKFFLYQTIGTSGGRDVEYFTISDDHYLAVANRYNGITSRLNSVIYSWNGTLFVFFQNVSTLGATDFNFFTIDKEPFLAAANVFDDVTNSISVIYKWKNKRFEKFQEIETNECRKSVAFEINNESYVAFADYVGNSVVYKWSGKGFLKLQTLHKAMDASFFYINDHAFLAIFSTQTRIDGHSFIYEWNGSKFVLFQSITTSGTWGSHSFVRCGQTFLGVTDRYSTKSSLYRFSYGQFIKYQEISSSGAIDMTSFEYKGHAYLVVANSGSKKNNINSTLYRWT